jgi:hypothetical protein
MSRFRYSVSVRYAVTLALTVFLYNIDSVLGFYVHPSIASVFYILMLSFFRTHISWILAVIESFAVGVIFCFALLKHLSLESQWLIDHYVDIMTYCYYLELAVIIMGGARSGLSAINRLRVAIHHFFKFLCSRIHRTEMAI